MKIKFCRRNGSRFQPWHLNERLDPVGCGVWFSSTSFYTTSDFQTSLSAYHLCLPHAGRVNTAQVTWCRHMSNALTSTPIINFLVCSEFWRLWTVGGLEDSLSNKTIFVTDIFSHLELEIFETAAISEQHCRYGRHISQPRWTGSHSSSAVASLALSVRTPEHKWHQSQHSISKHRDYGELDR